MLDMDTLASVSAVFAEYGNKPIKAKDLVEDGIVTVNHPVQVEMDDGPLWAFSCTNAEGETIVRWRSELDLLPVREGIAAYENQYVLLVSEQGRLSWQGFYELRGEAENAMHDAMAEKKYDFAMIALAAELVMAQ